MQEPVYVMRIKQYAAAQVVSISDPNERDVCHTLELRIHECARAVLLCAALPGLLFESD